MPTGQESGCLPRIFVPLMSVTICAPVGWAIEYLDNGNEQVRNSVQTLTEKAFALSFRLVVFRH